MADEIAGVLRRIADALDRAFPAPAPAPNDAPAWQWTAQGPRAVNRVDRVDPDRLIGLRAEAYAALDDVCDWVAGRAQRFVLFLDDFSFSDGDARYRDLKTLLEGGVVARPANLLVYATSNRRHLLPEYMADNEPELRGGELHPREAVQERIALADRFGLRIGFYAPDQDTYLKTVDRYLDLYGWRGARADVHREAIRFAIQAGGRSGRTAHQFVRALEFGD